jgi:hypothetical protein
MEKNLLKIENGISDEVLENEMVRSDVTEGEKFIEKDKKIIEYENFINMISDGDKEVEKFIEDQTLARFFNR